MAKTDKQAVTEPGVIPPHNPAPMDVSAFDDISSVEFGGQSPILSIAVGEVAGPLVYRGRTSMVLNNKEVVVHLASNQNEEMTRLPIASAFGRAMDQANIINGDTFAMKRLDDVQKKAGLGKGQEMQIYAIKVINRVERQSV